ncbi:beta-N-acetylhexosaminidase [Mariniphaga sediminis]|uniref:beta-N-acetylhexosaminidase n=1 Tax=Mariniphaga sediminis TaxID=1628158 RepID=UPI003563DE96
MKTINQNFLVPILSILFLINSQIVYGQKPNVEDWLIPRAQEISIGEDIFEYREGRIICPEINDPEIYPVVKSVQNIFEKSGHYFSFAAVEAKGEIPVIRLEIDNKAGIKPQGYKLIINPQSILLTANDKSGLFYGVQTIKQIVGFALSSTKGYLPTVQISDWPDFERRGVLLDMNKDKIPRMETFYRIIDQLASWKINELQIFFKHAFAFVNHPEVSQDLSPITAEQIIELDHYCKERFIDLVPYQDGFGKLSEWMKYERYLPLAECPEGCETRSGKYGPSSLSPAVPASLDLVDELYSESLPNYSSRYVNIGSDETFELGKGRSRELCEKYGVGSVYLDFLKEVEKRASSHGKRVQFWGDIILRHPELISELPKDMIPLVWGYEADHPFEVQLPKFKDSGLDFYVCPGTSTWNSILGRTDNAISNLVHAAEQGKKFNAMGYLNTNWGEYGNWHPLSTYYMGFLYGAAVNWAVENNKDLDVAFLLDRWVFKDQANLMGEIVMDLGNAHKLTGIELPNHSIFNRALASVGQSYKEDNIFSKLTIDGIEKADLSLVKSIDKLKLANMTCDDALQVYGELMNAAELCRHSCRLMKNKMLSKDGTLNNISEAERQFLIKDMSRIIANYRELWIKRNRVGGLERSVDKLQRILYYYKDL